MPPRMPPRLSTLVSPSHSNGKPCIKDFSDAGIAIAAGLPLNTIRDVKDAIKGALESGTLNGDKDMRFSPERARFVDGINTILRDTISVEELNSLYINHPDLELVRFMFYQLAMRCRATFLAKKKIKPAKKNPPDELLERVIGLEKLVAQQAADTQTWRDQTRTGLHEDLLVQLQQDIHDSSREAIKRMESVMQQGHQELLKSFGELISETMANRHR